MGKTSYAARNRWNAKAYDQLPIRVYKGKSVNGMVNEMLYKAIGLSEEEWRIRDPLQTEQ